MLPPQKTGPRPVLGDRLFIEAVLFRAKTGLPWRDLPERFGPWKSVYNRFSNWARKKRWEVIFHELTRNGNGRRSTVWTASSTASAIWSRSSSTGSSASAPSPLATRRLPETTWPSCKSAAHGCGLAEPELGARAAGDTSEAALAERTERPRSVASEEGQGPATGVHHVPHSDCIHCQSRRAPDAERATGRAKRGLWRAAAERGIPGVSPQKPSAPFPDATFHGTSIRDSP